MNGKEISPGEVITVNIAKPAENKTRRRGNQGLELTKF